MCSSPPSLGHRAFGRRAPPGVPVRGRQGRRAQGLLWRRGGAPHALGGHSPEADLGVRVVSPVRHRLRVHGGWLQQVPRWARERKSGESFMLYGVQKMSFDGFWGTEIGKRSVGICKCGGPENMLSWNRLLMFLMFRGIPDWPFHCFRASKSDDRIILWRPRTSSTVFEAPLGNILIFSRT